MHILDSRIYITYGNDWLRSVWTHGWTLPIPSSMSDDVLVLAKFLKDEKIYLTELHGYTVYQLS